ncbi:MAG: hypothetical protein JWQ33_2157 [Ramlibacter sp.]|nr:hypothetical protein [Ramlibacter sp.]
MSFFRVLAAPCARWVAAASAALMLAACGGGSSGSTPAPAAATPAPEVKIAFSAPQVTAGDSATLTWSSTNASSCAASGSWTGTQPTTGSLTFVLSAAGTFAYHLDCTGAGGTAGADATLAVVTPAVPVAPPPPPAAPAATNVLPVIVDRGPTGTSFNMPFVSVTVCSPGTASCRTIDRILVDTGSTGLRVMASALGSANDFPVLLNAASLPVAECAQFASGFAWGSVRRADIKLAGEVAAGMPIQVVADPNAPFTATPAACSNIGSDLGSVASLGANGILGVGMPVQDCGTVCVSSTSPRLYYACTSTGCATTVVPRELQLTNPVSAFAVNNNGLALTLPPVPVGGVSTLVGTLTFGIGTQTNNQPGNLTAYPSNSQGQFTTIYKGTSYTSSFIDSGSNGLFFDDPTIPTCSQFYCPPVPLSLTAQNVSPNGATATVTFTLENARALTSGTSAYNLGGALGLSRTFDWGLPFFFGRTVFVAIQGAQTPKGVGPYWAY